jgi:hypothetical protein
MNRSDRAALAVVLLASVLVGCGERKLDGGPTMGPSSLTCSHNPCEVAVAVTGSGANCLPSVPDPIIVKKTMGTVVIRWTAPSGYTFSNKPAPNEGIHYKEGPGSAINPQPGWLPGGKVWQIEDTPDPNAPAPVHIPYAIQLVAADGSVCKGPDPLITNL